MKVTLSFEKTTTDDVSIMVDALRASTTITLALNNFNRIIPCFTKEEALKIAEETGGILAGERDGIPIEGFDIGNSPVDIQKFKNQNTLILTTSNGTRILKDMNSTVLIGSLVNCSQVAKKAIELSKGEIDLVMAGFKGKFSIEDFLVCGEILNSIETELKNKNIPYEISDKGRCGILAIENKDNVKKAIYNGFSAKKLIKLGFEKDIKCAIQKNITKNVAIYKNGFLEKI